MADYTYEYQGPVSWAVDSPGPLETWFVVLRGDAFVYALGGGADLQSTLWFDIQIDSDFSAVWVGDTDIIIAGVSTNLYDEGSVVYFAGGADLDLNRLTPTDIAIQFDGSSDVLSTVTAYQYHAPTGGVWDSGGSSDLFIAIGSGFVDSAISIGPYSIVSTLYFDHDPVSGPPAFAVGGEADVTFKPPWQNVTIDSDFSAQWDYSADIISSIGEIIVDTPLVAVFGGGANVDISPGSVGAFITSFDSENIAIEISPATGGVFSVSGAAAHESPREPVCGGVLVAEAAADVAVGWDYTQSSAVFDTDGSSDRIIVGISVHTPEVGGSAEFSLGSDRLLEFVSVPGDVFVLAGEATVSYAYVEPDTSEPVDTTYTCESVPGRGASADGAYTETDQDGAWTENVGYAMSQGGERGAYTQDDAYVLLVKPNVFPTARGVPDTTITDRDDPTSTWTVRGKVTTSASDEDKLTSG